METMMRFSLLAQCRAAKAPDAPCIADASGELSNSQFLASILAAAGAFEARGVTAGDVVALMLPNQAEFVVAMFAAWHLGAAVTPINPALTPKEASHQISDSRAKLLVNGTGEAVVADVTTLPVTALKEGERHSGAPVDDPTALALLIYTSGTTGLPKGVMLDHGNIESMTEMGRYGLKISSTDHCLLILPLFHVNGIVVSILTPLACGARVTIRRRFDIETFFADIEHFRPTYFSAVPTIYTMLGALPDDVRPDVSSLRYGVCGAAPASAELLTSFEARFGFPLVEAYGLSEGTCGSTLNPVDGLRKAGTVGLPLPGQRIAIADVQGRHLPTGSTGEVLIRGRNVMRGYLNQPEATAKTVVNGWLHTGDIGRIDEDGYLSIVGRLKEMIIRGGENIYPKEIEDVLSEYPSVLEAAVVGAPDDRLGEIVIAYVSRRPGAAMTAEALVEHCAGRLARHKIPATIRIIDALPKNAVGKIAKPVLRELAKEQ
jgi:acyl-CoA synthetase (AMP-forming)/AMP-acid ligase II